MYVADCCAKCRHWELGTLDYMSRMKALENGRICPCHYWQGKETKWGEGRVVAYHICDSYEKAMLTNVPMNEVSA